MIAMWTLTGENSFGVDLTLRELVNKFVAEHGDLALERIDAQEASYERIVESLTSLPFLSARKLIVLRSAGTNKMFAENIEQIASDIPETNDVILVEPKLDKRLSYYKFLKKKTDFKEFNELDLAGLSDWLTKIAKQFGGSISNQDARYLVERVGMNQQLLFSELQKLIIYEPTINRHNIDLLTEPNPQSTIFQLLEAAFGKRKRELLDLYSEQRAMKVEPPQIVAMLAWQLHIIAIIKAAGDKDAGKIASDAKVNPYVVRKTQSLARAMTISNLKQLISDLLDIDVKMKSTSLDADEALQLYLLKMVS